MAWVVDDVTEHETTVIRRIRWTATDAPALAEPMLQKSWVKDGITRDEAIVIERLYRTIRVRDESLQQEVTQKAVEILAMPFLDTVESPDALAVWDLEKVERYRTNDFLSIMSHANVSDGITDQEAKVVSVLSSANRYKPDSLPILLDGLGGTNGVYLEERTIEATHSGEVQLTIIRVHDKDTPNMDRLEHAVRVIDEFMGEPLPTNYVAWYLDDAARSAGKGYHAGTHITSSLVYDIVDGDSKSRTPMQHIAHEVGHYYFRGNTHQWLDEGPAKFFESISERERVGRPVAYFKQSCSPAKTIQEQEQLRNDIKAGRVTPPDGWTSCDYYLGERFFVDLYLAMGDETFRPGLRSLYLKSQHDDPNDDCDGTDLSLCHVEAAFKTGVSDDVAAKVDEVIDRWYYGVAPVSTIADLPNGAWLEENHPARANRIKALPWVADGVDDNERDTAEVLIAAAAWDADLFDALLQKPWVLDSVLTADEARVISTMGSSGASTLTDAILEKSWVQDEITRDEATIIENLVWMAVTWWGEDAPDDWPALLQGAAIEILGMPFLDSVEGADASAVRSLSNTSLVDSPAFLEFLDHPTLSDGITDAEARIVAVLDSGSHHSDPVLNNMLLEPGQAIVEHKVINTPTSGDIELAVVRTRPWAQQSMDFLEHAVRAVEEFMGDPLPVSYVGLLLVDWQENFLMGTNFGTHINITMHPKYGDDIADTVAHEVAHYYWMGNRSWVDEGAANFMAVVSENARVGVPLEPLILHFCDVDSIAELDRSKEHPTLTTGCDYYLGEQLFLDLYRTLGRETFQQGFRSLYLKSRPEDRTDDCEGTFLDICHVEAAFKTGVSDDLAARVDEVIDRWYYGVVTRDEEYSYSISVSDAWVKESEGRYNHAASGSKLRITSFELGSSVTLEQYATLIRDGLQAEWWENPSLFEITSFHEEQINGQDFYSITYRVQESPEYCVVDVSELVTVSNALPGSQHGYRVRTWMCEDFAADYDQDRQQILYSFRVTTEPSTYYRQFLSVKGVVIKAKDTVDSAALYAAGDIVSTMLSGRRDIANCMANVGAGLAIIPKDEFVTTLPEFSYLKGTSDFTGRSRDSFAIRGLGAVKGQPVSATSEEQLLGLPIDQYPHNRFPRTGFITVHEFAHGIHNLCFTQNDWEQWGGFYDAAKQAGIFPGTHMMHNVDEFIAVFSTAYFEVTDEIGRDAGRSTVESDFPDIFEALEEIYGGAVLAAEYRERKF